MNVDFDQARVLAALTGYLDIETLAPKERDALKISVAAVSPCTNLLIRKCTCAVAITCT